MNSFGGTRLSPVTRRASSAGGVPAAHAFNSSESKVSRANGTPNHGSQPPSAESVGVSSSAFFFGDLLSFFLFFFCRQQPSVRTPQPHKWWEVAFCCGLTFFFAAFSAAADADLTVAVWSSVLEARIERMFHGIM